MYDLGHILESLSHLYPRLSDYEAMVAVKEQRKQKIREREARRLMVDQYLEEAHAPGYIDSIVIRYIHTGQGDLESIRERARWAVDHYHIRPRKVKRCRLCHQC